MNSNPEEANDTSGQRPSAAGGGSKKPALTKVLPSDRLTLERQTEALKAFAAVFEANNTAVTNAQAGEVAKMAANTIVVTNAFFTDIGLLTRSEGAFTVAPEVTGYLRAASGISPETAAEKLRPLFEKQWFTQLLAPRLRLGAMDLQMAIKVLGEACSAGKEHIPRLELLIDFLCFVGITKKEGNQIRLITGSAGGTERQEEKSDKTRERVKPPEEEQNGAEKYVLTLDAAKKRKITVYSPPEVSASELKRIQQWLSFQLLITDGLEGERGE